MSGQRAFSMTDEQAINATGPSHRGPFSLCMPIFSNASRLDFVGPLHVTFLHLNNSTQFHTTFATLDAFANDFKSRFNFTSPVIPIVTVMNPL